MIGLFGPFNLKERRGNSIRILLQAEGLQKNGFNDFILYSYKKNSQLSTIKQEEIKDLLFPKMFPYLQKIKGLFCDIAHVHHFFGAMVLPKGQKYILDMPSFISLQVNEIYKYEGNWLKRHIIRKFFLPLFIKKIERGIIKRAERVVAASFSIKKDILREIPGINPNKIIIITNPVNLNLYKISSQVDLVIGVAASNFTDNMDRACLEVVYQVAKRIPQIKFIVIGQMDARQKRKLNELSNIEIRGRVSHKDYINFLSEISVFLNPYLSFWDYGGSKFKLLEAGAAGLAVISSTNGAIGFEHKDALCLADNVEEICQEMEKLKDINYRKKKGQKLREIIEQEHNYITEAKKLINLYQDLSK